MLGRQRGRGRVPRTRRGVNDAPEIPGTGTGEGRRRGSADGSGDGDPHKLGECVPEGVRCRVSGRGRDSGVTARHLFLRRVRLPRPACTCSAASGSRCGSSSGTVNWIFRGLLSGSMAPGLTAAAVTAAALGLGRARFLSAALRPRPQPGSRLAAPGSAPRSAPELCCGLARHRPSRPSPSPSPEP